MHRFPSWSIAPTVLTICIALARCSFAQDELAPESVEFFERHVRPMLLENCVGCHSQSVNNIKGGLNLDSRASLLTGGDSGPAIDEAQPEKSLLLEAVRRQSLEMPPDRPLSSQQIAIFEKWLKMGAPWPNHPKVAGQGEGWLAARAAEHWSWQPLKSSPVPNAPHAWPQSPIDSFVLRELQSRGIDPSPPTARHELVRRLYVDLVGLPPTQQQLQSELRSGGDVSILVDRLLASPQYGVHWGRHWLDLMRYSETLGHEFDYPIRHAWRYRDAVINAFNEDLPYNQMLAEHIAGDFVSQPRIHSLTGIDESLASTAWWWLGDSVHAPVDAKNDWATRTENQVDVFSKAFLGMTVACARCHDHKFDAIGVSDYYGLVGVARSIRRRYAITDPLQKVAKHRGKLQQQIDSANSVVLSSWQATPEANIRRWLEHTITQWRSLTPEELNKSLPFGSPLYPLRLLVEQFPAGVDGEASFGKRFAELQSELTRAQDGYSKWQSESSLLADFSQGVPATWRFEAVQDKDWNEPPAIDWFEGSSPLPALPTTFRSQAWGRSQQVTLRSPTFPLSHRNVCLKLRGKSTQSTICVDGYFMNEFAGLLFADTRKPIDQPDEWSWVVHAGDLNKYVGDPTFISLETEGGAWFEIAEVRLSDRGPPVQPHPAAVALLKVNTASREALFERVVKQLHQSLSACSKTSSLGSTPEHRELEERANDAALARAMLRQTPEITLGPDATEAIRLLANKIQEFDAQSPEPTRLIAAEEGQPTDAAIELRGNPHKTSEPTPRGCFQSLVPWSEAESNSSGRQELVDSLTDPQHPLVARVMVNRVWFHLMGRGLVNSPDNFGVLGSRPTHPELLDYLAQQFIEQGWSIKWLVREIVLSQTYQLSSKPQPQHIELDADASLYSHRIVRRLDAEVLRDAIMLASGSLDERMSEPSVPVHLTQQMTGRGRPGGSGPLDGENRRSMFIEVRRNFLNPFLLAFDFPMPSTTTGKRNISNVPAQALGLLNDPLVNEMCQRWVTQTASISDHRQRIATLITTAFSRSATESEIDHCAEFVQQSGETGWIDLAHTLVNAKEFYFLK